jgi:hypothetical protein
MPTLFEPKSAFRHDWTRESWAKWPLSSSALPELWKVAPNEFSPPKGAAFPFPGDIESSALTPEARYVFVQVVRLRMEVEATCGAHVKKNTSPRTALEGGTHSCVNHGQPGDFLRAFVTNPEQAVQELLGDVAAKKRHPEQVATLLLPYLVKASYAQQSLVAGALEQVATPEQVLNAALALYERNRDPRLLSTADQLLASYGSASWPALKRLCGSMRPECRHFVNTVATLDQVSEDERREALLLLARNPDLDTQEQVLAALEMEVLSEPLPVWKILAQDRNGSIAAIAADWIAEHAE